MTEQEWAAFKAKIAGHTKGAWDDASRELVATVPTLVAEVERLRAVIFACADMIDNCAGVPRNPDSLPMMVLHELRTALTGSSH